MKFKRKLSDREKMIAQTMLTLPGKERKTLGQVARFFRTNKPSVLKAIGVWKPKAKKAWRGVVANREVLPNDN